MIVVVVVVVVIARYNIIQDEKRMSGEWIGYIYLIGILHGGLAEVGCGRVGVGVERMIDGGGGGGGGIMEES